ncbi:MULTISPECIES: hypothetical protein [Bacillaceae]|uniref:Uncharacterized protein n=1 Tax=Evansella alkalicola TaxID=745819 RepID=A0ABS6JPV3_9BACI|nr:MULTISPECIES: hypothetical protein [Bacillaceae]MBU9720593.1 hypothetical protein [Bacillus alkalicola]
MKKTLSPFLVIGLLIFVTVQLVERFITHIPNLIAMLLLLVAIFLIIYGGRKK